MKTKFEKNLHYVADKNQGVVSDDEPHEFVFIGTLCY